MSQQDIESFSPRNIAVLIAVGALAFAGAVYFTLFGDSGRPNGANSYSLSAIGHKAFVELLREQGISVIVSRNESESKARNDSLLIVAEPLPEHIELRGLLPRADRTLVVLPKWHGLPNPKNREWIGNVAQRPDKIVESVLHSILPAATLNRPSHDVQWKKTSLSALHVFRPGQLNNDIFWNRLRTYDVPEIAQPQLIVTDRLTPIIASAEGILVGGMQVGDGWLYVVSDPDLLSNYGLGRGDNAALIIDALKLFRPDDSPVVIDETMHGFKSIPNLWRTIFELPFVAATILVFAAIIVLLWSATSRFGAPLGSERGDGERESGLIENAVDLLHQTGHGGDIARRYPEVVLRQVALRLHMPRRLAESDRVGWVDRIGAARGVATRYQILKEEIEGSATGSNYGRNRVLKSVQRLYQWKQEMLDGSGNDSNG